VRQGEEKRSRRQDKDGGQGGRSRGGLVVSGTFPVVVVSQVPCQQGGVEFWHVSCRVGPFCVKGTIRGAPMPSPSHLRDLRRKDSHTVESTLTCTAFAHSMNRVYACPCACA